MVENKKHLAGREWKGRVPWLVCVRGGVELLEQWREEQEMGTLRTECHRQDAILPILIFNPVPGVCSVFVPGSVCDAASW